MNYGAFDKAKESGAGAVIGSLAYRSHYEAVLTKEKWRTTREKKYSFMTDYHSDNKY
jgi:hypothetical protein